MKMLNHLKCQKNKARRGEPWSDPTRSEADDKDWMYEIDNDGA